MNIKKALTHINKKNSMIFGTIVLSLLLLISVGAFIGTYQLAATFLKRPTDGWPEPEASGSRENFAVEIQQAQDWLSQQQVENISITSFDGLTLRGIYIPVEKDRTAKGTILCFHGFHSTASFEYAGFYTFFHDNGYNVVLPDMRAHGKSDGTYITFGIKERFDVQSWAQYIAAQQPEQSLWMVGVSLGCASVLMSTGTSLPPQIKGIIADCGFTSPYEIVKCVMIRDMHLPASIILPFSNFFIKYIADFKLTEYSTLEALKTNTIPILFIHGKNDTYIPIEMSYQNFAACTSEKYALVTGAGHAANFLYNPEDYMNALTEFIAKTASH
ncbi:MAG: alpha/beta hydrolase [Treponema sp.]|nr:alpha/beta hydrolase [Treponema sp.]